MKQAYLKADELDLPATAQSTNASNFTEIPIEELVLISIEQGKMVAYYEGIFHQKMCKRFCAYLHLLCICISVLFFAFLRACWHPHAC